MNIESENADSVVSSVIVKMRSRAIKGKEKYGVTMDRNDLNIRQWLVHLQEEQMDAVVYIEKLIQELDKTK